MRMQQTSFGRKLCRDSVELAVEYNPTQMWITCEELH